MSYLIAIGGHTGTGKTTLAYKLRKSMSFLKDAIVIEDDVIRRELLGLHLKAIMKPEDYSPDVSERVIKLMESEIADALCEGQTVINSSGFFNGASRSMVRRWAGHYKAQFVGLWLVAPRDVMEIRIRQRLEERKSMNNLSIERGHASDACIGVIDKFGDIGMPTSPDWHIVDAGFSEEKVMAQCAKVLGSYQT